MGFPGRLNEKKKPTVVFWGVIVVIVAVFGWMVWSVVEIIREPLPVQRQDRQPVQIQRDVGRGLLEGKADHALDNLEQVKKKDFLTPPPKRENSRRGNGTAVTYEPAGGEPKAGDQKAGYYSQGEAN